MYVMFDVEYDNDISHNVISFEFYVGRSLEELIKLLQERYFGIGLFTITPNTFDITPRPERHGFGSPKVIIDFNTGLLITSNMATDWFQSDPRDEEKADGIKGPDGVDITWEDATDQMKFNSRLLTVLNNLRSLYVPPRLPDQRFQYHHYSCIGFRQGFARDTHTTATNSSIVGGARYRSSTEISELTPEEVALVWHPPNTRIFIQVLDSGFFDPVLLLAFKASAKYYSRDQLQRRITNYKSDLKNLLTKIMQPP